MKEKQYWIFHRIKKKAFGPYTAQGLSNLAFFRPEAKVAPYGTLKKEDWRPASEYPELRPYLKDRK